MNTISNEVIAGRRRRNHSAEFKAQVIAACLQPGVSLAAVAMAHGVNANLARRWVNTAQAGRVGDTSPSPVATSRSAVARSTPAAKTPAFIPLQVPAAAATQDIRIELRRGATAITVNWPASEAAQCAAWMRELLR